MEDAVAQPNFGIFPELEIRPLVLEWKKRVAEGDQDATMDVLSQVVVASTEMFKRLAQYEQFHKTVPLDDLVVAAQKKIPYWLEKWDPAKGTLFSFMSRCAKNVFRGEIVKTLKFTTRIHTTGEDVYLEQLSGTVDHKILEDDAMLEFSSKIKELTCPWAGTTARGAIRFIIECIQEESHNRAAAIRGTAFAWGLSLESAKFLYNWTLIQLRDMLYDKDFIPWTTQDLVRALYSTQILPNSHAGPLIDIMGIDAYMKCCAVLPGLRTHWPSLSDIDKTVKNYRLHQDILHSTMDPSTVEKIARTHGRTEKSATEVFTVMTRVLDPRMSGDYSVYDEHPYPHHFPDSDE